MNLQAQLQNENQTDIRGMLSRRDRIFASVVSIAMFLSVAGILISKKTGSLALSADSVIQKDAASVIWLIILGLSVLIFILGLLLAFFKYKWAMKILGWALVSFSVVAIVLLSSQF